MQEKTILIKGVFSDEDLKLLAAILRIIERHHPENLYQMTIKDDSKNSEQAKEFLGKLFPALPDNNPEIQEFKTLKEIKLEMSYEEANMIIEALEVQAKKHGDVNPWRALIARIQMDDNYLKRSGVI